MTPEARRATQKLRALTLKTLRLKGETSWAKWRPASVYHDVAWRTDLEFKTKLLLRNGADIHAPLVLDGHFLETTKRFFQGTLKPFARMQSKQMSILDGLVQAGSEHFPVDLALIPEIQQNPEILGFLVRHCKKEDLPLLLSFNPNLFEIEHGFDLGCYEHTTELFQDLVAQGKIQLKDLEPWFQKYHQTMQSASIATLLKAGLNPQLRVQTQNGMTGLLQYHLDMQAYFEYKKEFYLVNGKYSRLFEEGKCPEFFLKSENSRNLVNAFSHHFAIIHALVETGVSLQGLEYQGEPFSFEAWHQSMLHELEFVDKHLSSFKIWSDMREECFKNMEILSHQHALQNVLPQSQSKQVPKRL